MRALTLACSLLLACGGPSELPETPEMRGGCENAGARLAKLGCEAAKGSPGPDLAYGTADDVSFAEACVDLERTGLVELNTHCLANARSCEEADGCAEVE